MGRDEEFTEYATARAGRLRETAYLMCGDWHQAQDLTQAALARVYVAWPRIMRRDAMDAYVRKVLLREFLTVRRRRSATELPTARPPDVAITPEHPELRLTLLDALTELPPNQRAIVVLRYWEDQSIEATAEALGTSVGAVKSASLRALRHLRALLGDDFPLTTS